MTNYTQDNDQLYRYLFKDRAVRGEWVRLNQTFNDTLNTHHYPQAVRNLLGEMMVATSLLTATLKFNGNITVQIQGDGPLKLALVNGDDQQRIRALARLQGDIQEGMSLHEMIGKGVLVITIAPQEGERYQGVVPLDKPTITECLEDYFIRSEQLQTQLIIRTGEYQGQPVAAGMLLQIVPDGSGSPEDFEPKNCFIAYTTKKSSNSSRHKQFISIAVAPKTVPAQRYCSFPTKKSNKSSPNTMAASICNANAAALIISSIKKRLRS